jgi:molybdopterin-guanine dinucleotide biosynthesis adapter protein
MHETMKAFALIGGSMHGKSRFVEDLIAALHLDGHAISVIKHTPDGFDLDSPGKASYNRREAGCREVMLVGDRRLVLMQEYGRDSEPPLEALFDRLSDVDIVMVEGFKSAHLPAIEVCAPSTGRPMRWPDDPKVFAVVSDEPLKTALPVFAVADAAGQARCVALHLGLRA